MRWESKDSRFVNTSRWFSHMWHHRRKFLDGSIELIASVFFSPVTCFSAIPVKTREIKMFVIYLFAAFASLVDVSFNLCTLQHSNFISVVVFTCFANNSNELCYIFSLFKLRWCDAQKQNKTNTRKGKISFNRKQFDCLVHELRLCQTSFFCWKSFVLWVTIFHWSSDAKGPSSELL